MRDTIMRPRNRMLAKVGVAVLSLLLSLGVAEGVARLVYTPPEIRYGWVGFVSPFERNQLGFRGRPIEYDEDDFVIVLLGDSQVAANACAFGWMPEKRLEKHLSDLVPSRNFRVITIGATGYGQDQQLLMLAEFFRRGRADMVVLWQIFENDVWNNVFPTHWPANGAPKPTFRLENGRLVGPNAAMGQPMARRTALRLVDLARNALTVRTDLDDVWEEEFLPEPYRPLADYDGPVNSEWQRRWDINLGLMRHENLANEKSHFAVGLVPPSPRTRYGLDLTRALLREIRSLVEANAGRFLILVSEEPSPPPSEASPDVYVLNGKYYRHSEKQVKANREYVNAGMTTFTVPITVDDYRVGPTDSHLNEHAVDQVMRDLARLIGERMLRPATADAPAALPPSP